jgi:hypothetical protein
VQRCRRHKLAAYESPKKTSTSVALETIAPPTVN